MDSRTTWKIRTKNIYIHKCRSNDLDLQMWNIVITLVTCALNLRELEKIWMPWSWKKPKKNWELFSQYCSNAANDSHSWRWFAFGSNELLSFDVVQNIDWNTRKDEHFGGISSLVYVDISYVNSVEATNYYYSRTHWACPDVQRFHWISNLPIWWFIAISENQLSFLNFDAFNLFFFRIFAQMFRTLKTIFEKTNKTRKKQLKNVWKNLSFSHQLSSLP